MIMDYSLPKSLFIGEKEYPVRYDYRCILDICAVLEEPELERGDRVEAAIQIFYPELEEIPDEDLKEAIERCFWFINGGEGATGKEGPKLVSWEKDVKYIISPINRVIGQEIRAIPYDIETNTGGLHWWTFLSAYMEIGDCTFAQIVRVRSQLAKGKPLDKFDKEWYMKNKEIVDLRARYTKEEEEYFAQFRKK